MNTTGFPIDVRPSAGQLIDTTLAEHCAARYERYGMRCGLPLNKVEITRQRGGNSMHRSIGSFLRFAAIAFVTAGCAGCMAMPAPQFGPGPPPMLTPKKAHTLGAAPITGAAVRFAFATVTGVPAELRFQL